MYVISADDGAPADLLLDAEVVLKRVGGQVGSCIDTARIQEVADVGWIRGIVVGLGCCLVLMENILAVQEPPA